MVRIRLLAGWTLPRDRLERLTKNGLAETVRCKFREAGIALHVLAEPFGFHQRDEVEREIHADAPERALLFRAAYRTCKLAVGLLSVSNATPPYNQHGTPPAVGLSCYRRRRSAHEAKCSLFDGINARREASERPLSDGTCPDAPASRIRVPAPGSSGDAGSFA
jgi:hypothetical protein